MARPRMAAEKQKALPAKPAPLAPRPVIAAQSIKKASPKSVSRRRSNTAENDESYVAEDVVVHYSKKGGQDTISASGTNSRVNR